MSFDVHRNLRLSLAAIRKDGYTPSHIAVLEAIASRINDKTWYCFPSVATIAEESYLSERHARKVLRELERDGIVQIVSASRQSNRYYLNLPNHHPASKQPRHHGGVSGGSEASENRESASEARLISNSNLSIKKEVLNPNSYIKHPQDSFKKNSDIFPVQRSNKKEIGEPETPALQFYRLLMKKIGAKDAVPSNTDIAELEAALDKYGAFHMRKMLDWIYRRKNDYWRKALKNSNYPCSVFCKKLYRFTAQTEEDLQSSEARQPDSTLARNLAAMTDEKETDQGDDEEGITSFTIDEDEL